MSRCISETALLVRYAGSGALNTIVGFAVIFALMWMGFSPYTANMVGYMTGFILGFVVSKKFVFRSDGHFVGESIRYLLAFLICFFLNLATLQFVWMVMRTNVFFAQLMAAVVYTGAMYLFARWFVFNISKNDTKCHFND